MSEAIDPDTSDYESDPELDYTIGGTPILYVQSVKIIKETKTYIYLKYVLISNPQRARNLAHSQKCACKGYRKSLQQSRSFHLTLFIIYERVYSKSSLFQLNQLNKFSEHE